MTAPRIAHATPDQLFAFLDELGIRTETITHPPVYTVEEAKALRGPLPGGHCKSLFLRDKKKAMALVVALEDTPVDLKTIGEALGMSRLSFASPERLMETLGVIPGSVTPFALINDKAHSVRVVLEARMMAERPLHYHPLRNDMTTAIAPEDLERFVRACGHSPEILDLTPPA